jgi:hypothetical protein
MAKEALETANILNFFDKLFDSVNGGTFHSRYGKPLSGRVYKESGHIHFWQEAIRNIRNMYFIGQDGKRHVPPSLTNWIRTLEGFLDLNNVLVESGKFKYFLPRSLNQDVIENYFGKIRNQRTRNINPTALQFRDSFKSLLIRDFCGKKSIGTNCEATKIPDLFNIRNYIDNMNKNNYSVENIDNSFETCPIYKYISKVPAFEFEKNLHKSIIGYVSGWIQKTLKNIECESCVSQISGKYSENEQCYNLINEREYNLEIRKLKYCDLQFIKNINKIYNISKIILSNITSPHNIRNKILIVIPHYVKFSFTCEHKSIIENEINNKIINLIIFNFSHGINLVLSGKDTRAVEFKNKIYKNAMQMYRKRLKIKLQNKCSVLVL